jgi:hypothetical protein
MSFAKTGPKRWLNQHLFEAWDKIIVKCESHLENRVFRFRSYKDTVVRERLVQLVESMCFGSFSQLCVRRLRSGDEPIPPTSQILEVGGLIINPIDGKIQISLQLLFRQLALFVMLWLRLFANILLGFFRVRKRIDKSATLFLGLTNHSVFYQDSDERFVRFCRNGLIKPLMEAQQLFIQMADTKKSSSNPTFFYLKNPIDILVRGSQLDMRIRLRLVFAHLHCLFSFFYSIIRFPLLSLMARDIPYIPSVQALDYSGFLDAVVITNSSYSFQPLWMRESIDRHFRVHEIYYSQNSKPFVYKFDPFSFDFPAFRHVNVDEHWVWTEGYKTHLEELGHKKDSIHVIGPILFYQSELSLSPQSDNEIRVAVFDVTPANLDYVDKLGAIDYYYRSGNVIKYIEGVIEACKVLESRLGKPVRILLKHKRGFTKGVHDLSYADFIKRLSESHPRFDLVPYDENVFSLLTSCDFSISIPYTSVAYIANHLEKHAVYFDSTEELLPSHEPASFIKFASGKVELMQVVEKIMSDMVKEPFEVSRKKNVE